MGISTSTEPVTLFDANGKQLAVTNGVAVPTTIVGIPQMGSDGVSTRIAAFDVNGVQYGADLVQAIQAGRIPNSLANSLRGQVATSATTEVPIRQTAYVEQASNAQRSMNSTSANDTNTAGTGARSILITYYSMTAGIITGPFFETVLLNGVTAVNTVSATICFIERMELITVGSNAKPVGNIQLFAAAAGAGGVIASIAATFLQTNYIHHYIANGRSCYITTYLAFSTAASTQVVQHSIRSFDYTITNAAERTLFENIAIQGTSGSNQTTFGTPRKALQNNRILAYATPSNAPAQTQGAAMSFYEY
jgi:hypothetical protein